MQGFRKKRISRFVLLCWPSLFEVNFLCPTLQGILTDDLSVRVSCNIAQYEIVRQILRQLWKEICIYQHFSCVMSIHPASPTPDTINRRLKRVLSEIICIVEQWWEYWATGRHRMLWCGWYPVRGHVYRSFFVVASYEVFSHSEEKEFISKHNAEVAVVIAWWSIISLQRTILFGCYKRSSQFVPILK